MTLLHLQIIVDAVFFAVILILLWQLKRSIAKSQPHANGASIQELKKIMAESREFAGEFMTAVEDNKSAIHTLARQLDDKAKRLMALLEEAERSIKKLESCREKSAPVSTKEKYDDIIKMIEQGMSLEDVAKKSGVTEGEISLVMELVRTRSDK